MGLEALTQGSSNGTGPDLPNLAKGEIVGVKDGMLQVLVPAFSRERPYEVEDASGSFAAGDEVLVGFDEDGNPWLIGARSDAFSAADYGASPSKTAAENASAINAALAAAGATGGGIVTLGRGSFLTTGGHDIPVGVTVAGLRRQATDVFHRGSGYCFRLMDETSGGAGCALRDLSVTGSDGSLPAVAGAIGVEISNGQGSDLENVFIYGFTAADSVGLRFHNVNGTVEYVEQSHISNIAVVNCKTLMAFVSDSGAGNSFGYTQILDAQLQIYADQTAIKVGGGGAASMLYNSRILASLHYTGNNGKAFDLAASGSGEGQVWQGTWIDIRGEMLGAYTGCKRIVNAGDFDAHGKLFIANGQPPDDTSSASWHNFVEETLTSAEAQSVGHDFAIASAAFGMAIPPGVDFVTVTGTTNITGIAGTSEGRVVTLCFASSLTVNAGGNVKLAGNVAFAVTADDTLTLAYRGGTYYEVGRSVN